MRRAPIALDLPRRVFLLLLAAILLPFPVAGQEGAWNTPEVMDLVARAVDRRLMPLQDSLLFSYTARAEGHIHFLADRLDGSDPIPLRVDQVALDLYWMAPDLTRQEIRGLRAEELLPIKDFRYYLDRLTVIQNGFGDVIQVGQGMDVRSVPHPLARYVQEYYDYALGDSVTVRLPGAPEPVRVVEVKVRPRDPGQPGYLGSLFLDASSGAISKLEFTFTPSSYVDRRIDRVRITLEHGLWQGRWWLPYRQQVEVRREIPELDIRVQSVIQGVLTVEDYGFNEALPVSAFLGPTVVFPGDDSDHPAHFRRPLFAEMEAQGLQRPELALLEAEARKLVRDRALSGLPSTRLHWDRVSSLVRANRTEGVYGGAGLSRSVGPDTRVSLLGGWASGARRPVGTARLRFDRPEGPHLRLEGVSGGVRDVGQTPGMDPFLNTVSTLFLGRDYSDLYRVDGGSAGIEWWREGGAVVRLTGRYEEHTAAPLAWREGPVGDPRAFRAPPRVEEGRVTAGRLEVEGPWHAAGVRLGGRLAVETGAFHGDLFGQASGEVSWSRRSPDGSRGGRVSLEGGVQGGDGLPWQQRFLLGGAGTLPGHPYRGWGGNRYMLVSGEAERGLIPRWVSARVVGAVGAVGGEGSVPGSAAAASCPPPDGSCPPPPPAQGAVGSRGLKASVGAGLGFIRGILRVDRMWGVDGGEGEWSVSVHPSFRPWL